MEDIATPLRDPDPQQTMQLLPATDDREFDFTLIGESDKEEEETRPAASSSNAPRPLSARLQEAQTTYQALRRPEPSSSSHRHHRRRSRRERSPDTSPSPSSRRLRLSSPLAHDARLVSRVRPDAPVLEPLALVDSPAAASSSSRDAPIVIEDEPPGIDFDDLPSDMDDLIRRVRESITASAVPPVASTSSSATQPLPTTTTELVHHLDPDVFVDAKLLTDRSLVCEICMMVAREIVSLEFCSHTICMDCYKKDTRVGGSAQDKKRIKRIGVGEYTYECPFQCPPGPLFLNVTKCGRASGQMKDLRIKCPNCLATEVELGTDWAIFHRHLKESCPARMVQCSFCKCAMTARDLEAHKTSCPQVLLPDPCSVCGERVTRGEAEQHFQDVPNNNCPNFYECPKGCTHKDMQRVGLSPSEYNKIPRAEKERLEQIRTRMTKAAIPNHVANECPLRVVVCPVPGCGKRGHAIRMHRHALEDGFKHLHLLSKAIAAVAAGGVTASSISFPPSVAQVSSPPAAAAATASSHTDAWDGHREQLLAPFGPDYVCRYSQTYKLLAIGFGDNRRTIASSRLDPVGIPYIQSVDLCTRGNTRTAHSVRLSFELDPSAPTPLSIPMGIRIRLVRNPELRSPVIHGSWPSMQLRTTLVRTTTVFPDIEVFSTTVMDPILGDPQLTRFFTGDGASFFFQVELFTPTNPHEALMRANQRYIEASALNPSNNAHAVRLGTLAAALSTPIPGPAPE